MQAPSTVNDCARQMMATIRTQCNDASWFNWGYTVTRVSGTSFTVVTAAANTVTLPAAFETTARIKLYDTSTLYGTITTVSASAASTLVTFTPDAGSLTASFSSVYNSILSPTNTAIPGLTIPTDVVTQKTQQIFALDTGATNSAQITLVPTLAAYATGELINFKAAATNTGATTLQVAALGSKTIKKLGGASDLAAGDIIAGQMVSVLYDGTTFQMVSGLATSGSGGGSGSIAQVVQVTKTSSYSAAVTTPTDITGLTLSITPTKVSSTILILSTTSMAVTIGQNGFLNLLRNGIILTKGDAASTRTQSTASIGTGQSFQLNSVPINYQDSPSSVAAVTYKLQAWADTGSIYVNRSISDIDSTTYGRTTSSIIAMELLA